MRRSFLIPLIVPVLFLSACNDDDNGSGNPIAPRIGLLSEYLMTGSADDSQGTNDGTPAGGPVFTTDRFGNSSKAVSFDGADDVITTAQDDFANGNNVSLSLWFKMPSTAGGLRYFVMSSDFGMLTSGATAGMAISVPSTNSAVGTFTTANAWHHLLGTYDGNNITVFIDGALAAATNHPGDITDANRPLTFGFFNAEYWAGELDDVRIYDRAITSATDIYNLYHEGGYGL